MKGPLSEKICKLTNLEYLYIMHQGFDGNIPDCMWDFEHIEWFWIVGNELTGNFPEDIGFRNVVTSGNLKTFQMEGNKLGGIMPDSFCNVFMAVPFDWEFYDCFNYSFIFCSICI